MKRTRLLRGEPSVPREVQDLMIFGGTVFAPPAGHFFLGAPFLFPPVFEAGEAPPFTVGR